MIGNNYNNKINFASNVQHDDATISAYDKLLGYRKTVERSDMRNSKTRYERELQYIQDAIDEAKRNNQNELVETLEGSKAQVSARLRQFEKEDKQIIISGPFIKPHFIEATPEGRLFCFSDENRKIYNNFTEEELSKFDELQEKFGLTDDKAVEYMLLDEDQLIKFNNLMANYEGLTPNYAVYIAQFNEEQDEIFNYAINDLGFEPDDASDFVNMYKPIGPNEEAQSLEYALTLHGELKELVNGKVAESIGLLSTYGIDVPSMLDNNGISKHYWKKDVGSLRDDVKEDIIKLAKAYKSLDFPPGAIAIFSHNKVINKNIQDNIKQIFTPIIRTQEELEQLETGDVFRMYYDGEECLCIAQNNDYEEATSYKLDMSADTYLKLFPPILRHSSLQDHETGDCFLVTTLNLLYGDKNQRKYLLSKFKEDSDGKVRIKINDQIEYIYDPTRKNPTDEKHLKGAPGLQALETAYGMNMIFNNIEEATQRSWMGTIDKILEKMEEVEKKMAYSDDYDEFMEYKRKLASLEEEFDKIREAATKGTDLDYSLVYDDAINHAERNKGGTINKACQNIGLDMSLKYFDRFKKFEEYASAYPNCKFYLATKGDSDKKFLDESLNMVQNHAYMVEYKNGKYYVINPWISAQQIEIPKEKLEKFTEDVFIINEC